LAAFIHSLLSFNQFAHSAFSRIVLPSTGIDDMLAQWEPRAHLAGRVIAEACDWNHGPPGPELQRPNQLPLILVQPISNLRTDQMQLSLTNSNTLHSLIIHSLAFHSLPSMISPIAAFTQWERNLSCAS
jgi:hypothetical protein